MGMQGSNSMKSRVSNVSMASNMSNVSGMGGGKMALARRVSLDKEGKQKHRYDIFIAHFQEGVSGEIKTFIGYMKELKPELKFYIDDKNKSSGELREILSA